jgi:NAD(P)-dependent dehydrogenase (short-subunit alcohol dehydrogenase family)
MPSENSHSVPGSALVVGVGASQGAGAAIARRFERAGYPVVIAGRNEERRRATFAELEAAGARRFVAAAHSLAPLAVAVHNAGSNNPAPFLKVSEAQFEAHWREHTLGGFQTAQAVIPAFL